MMMESSKRRLLFISLILILKCFKKPQMNVVPRSTGNTNSGTRELTSVGIEPTTYGLDLPSLCRLSYKVAQRAGTILDGESRRRGSMGTSECCAA